MEVEEIEDDFFSPPSKPDPAPVQSMFKPQVRAGRRAGGGPMLSGGPSMSMLGDNGGAGYQPSAQSSNALSTPAAGSAGDDGDAGGGAGGYQPSGGGGGYHPSGGGYQPSGGSGFQASGDGGDGGYQPGGGSSYQPGGRRRRNFLLGGVQAKDPAPMSMLPADPPKQEHPSSYQPSSMDQRQVAQPHAEDPPLQSISPAERPAVQEPAPTEEQAYVPSMGRRGRPAPQAAQDWSTQQAAPHQPARLPDDHPPPQPAAALPPAQETPAPAPAPASKPAGGFKFKFGKMATPERQPSPEPAPPPAAPSPPAQQAPAPAMPVAVQRPPSSTHSYTPPESREGLTKPSHGAAHNSSVVSGPTGAGARNASPGPGPASGAAAVNASKDSILSDLSRISSKGGVQKTDRLRALEQELAALHVTTKLGNAYMDDQGRDMKPKPKKKKVDVEELQARVDTGLGNDADASARNELLKAYHQVKRYQLENEKLKEQLDTCMNAYDEIARLKNMVAEKVQVISVLEKERAALHKLHKQYQKEKLDQDAIESQYGERVRRVNEELRVAKAKLQKYKEIHNELEGSLGKAQDRVRQLEDKNRELRQKLTSITGSSKVPVDPEKVKKKLAEKDEQIKKLEHEKEVLQKVADSANRKLEARDKQRLLGKQEAEENNAELRKQLEDKTRALKETQALLHRQQSRMQRLKLEHNKLRDLNKDRLKLEKILDEPLADDDASIFLTGIDSISRASSVNSMVSSSSRSSKRAVKPRVDVPVRHFNAETDRVPQLAFQAAPKQGSRGDPRWKPESPAEMAAMFDKNKGADDAGGTGYMSLLSPQAKSALEEARTWRSTASKTASHAAASPMLRSPMPHARQQGGDGDSARPSHAESAVDEDVTLEALGGAAEEKEGGYLDDANAAEVVGDEDEDGGEYKDDFEDVDLEELSRRSSRASVRAAADSRGHAIATFAKAPSSKSIAGRGHADPAAVPDASRRPDVSMVAADVEEEDLVDSPRGDDVEDEDMDFLLAGLTNEQGPPTADGGLPKLPLRQGSDAKSDAASSNPSTNRSKGSKAAKGAPGKKPFGRQPSTKATPRGKPVGRR